MSTKKKTILTATAAFLLGLGGAYFGTTPIFESIYSQTKIHAMWKDHFTSLQGLRDGVDAVVLAEVVDIVPGRIVGDAGNPEVKFTNVILQVRGALRGDTPRDIVLEVTGDLLGERRVVFLEMPEYEVGERYLLFLNRSEDSDVWYVVNNQGGYRVVLSESREAFLQAADPEDEVAAELHGMELGAALGRIGLPTRGVGDRNGSRR